MTGGAADCDIPRYSSLTVPGAILKAIAAPRKRFQPTIAGHDGPAAPVYAAPNPNREACLPIEPQTVHEAFAATTARTPHAPFLCVPSRPGRTWLPDGVELSYGEVAERVERLSVRYARAGYTTGHRVALLLENRPAFFEHYLALNALGCGIVPVNPEYRHDELVFQMSHSKADLAVAVSGRVADLVRAAAERGKPLPVVDADHLPASFPAPVARAGDWQPGIEAECSLLYTSGTTGRPKACILTNRYYLEAGRWYRDLGGLAAIHEGRDRIYNPLPLYHMNAQAVTATMVMLTGNCMILPERFSPSRWWGEIAETRATVIHYLGVVPPLLLGQPPSADDRAHQVRFGLGAGVEPQLHAAFEERFAFPLVEIWGMTETGRILAVTGLPRLIDTRAFGRPTGGLEARVVDAQDRELPRGSDGEFIVRWGGAEGPRHGFFSGYLDNEAATAEAWRGGWFHTGDIVRQDASGMLYFVDRSKNIIRRSGENVAAAEVEAVLQSAPWVKQVAVVACPDEVREAEVLACVVPRAGTSIDAALARDLHDWAAERLAYYKAPGWVLFLDALPTTGTQKIQKHQIFGKGEDPRQRAGIHDLRHLKKRR
jgi:crotonobetaine/carnitine-CoA ligase